MSVTQLVDIYFGLAFFWYGWLCRGFQTMKGPLKWHIFSALLCAIAACVWPVTLAWAYYSRRVLNET